MDAIKTTLFTVISDIRYFLLAGFQNLPLSIAGLMIVLGFFTAHYPFLFFLIGYLILLPAIMFGINLIPLFAGWNTNAPACSLIASYAYPDEKLTEPETGLGYWVPMTFFFIGYMITNAARMFTYEPPPVINTNGTITQNPNDDSVDVTPGFAARKTHTVTGMVIIAILAIIVLVIRIKTCGWWPGVLLGALVGGGLGVGWYHILMAGIPTDQRLNDMFGIASRLLVPYAVADVPYACVPPTATTA